MSKLQLGKTSRGFDFTGFKDGNGVKCSLQKSSVATDDMIWFGCNDADPKILVPGKSWQAVEMPYGYQANTRMHLTQDQVKKLLPHLIAFVDSGELTFASRG